MSVLKAIVATLFFTCFSAGLHAERTWQELTKSAEGKGQSIALFATVTVPFINMHTGAGRGYPVFHVMERGSEFAVIKRKNDWFKVVTPDNASGWITAASLNGSLDLDKETIAVEDPDSTGFGKKPFELGINVGAFGGTDAVALYGSYHFIDKLAGVLTYSENFGDFSSGRAVGLTIEARPFPYWRASPFFILGGGQRWTKTKESLAQSQDTNNGFFQVGLGLHVFVTSRFAFRAEYSQHIVLTNIDDDQKVQSWNIGLSTFF